MRGCIIYAQWFAKALVIRVNNLMGHQVFRIGALVDKALDKSFSLLVSYFRS